MLLIAHILQDEALIDVVCPLVSSIDSDYRDTCFNMCCSSPKTEIQRKTIIQAFTEKKYQDITRAAESILRDDFDREEKKFKTLKFTEGELAEISRVVTSPFLREWLYL